MTNLVNSARGSARAALARALALLGLWIVLIGAKPADLAIGLVTVTAATWTSLHLLAPSGTRVRARTVARARAPLPVAVGGCRMGRRAARARSAAAVASRLRAPIPVRLPPGTARNAFITLTSLLPGTVPAGDEGGTLVYHCLDVDQPVVSQLAAEEAALSRVLGHD